MAALVVAPESSSHDRPGVLGLTAWRSRVPSLRPMEMLVLAAAGLTRMARCDKGDCQTPLATKSLVPVAPDPKFQCCLTAAPATVCFDFDGRKVSAVADR